MITVDTILESWPTSAEAETVSEFLSVKFNEKLPKDLRNLLVLLKTESEIVLMSTTSIAVFYKEWKASLVSGELIYGGEIAHFPKEVVEKMLEHQVDQGNPRSVEVFENNSSVPNGSGGFSWAKTKEGQDFWLKVVSHQNFAVFFEKYPK